MPRADVLGYNSLSQIECGSAASTASRVTPKELSSMYFKPTRVCRSCKCELPRTEFDHTHYGGKTELGQVCRTCRAAYHARRAIPQPYNNGDGTLHIPLTRGKFALIDENDYDLIGHLKWHATPSKNTFYAFHSVRGAGVIVMHRIILAAPQGTEVDHIDGNGLNNRRSNLRLCTRSQNSMNTQKLDGTTSRYKGVYWFRGTSKWHARITVNRERRHLGFFSSEIDAARTYDEAARSLFGEFARLNFPNDE